MYFETQKLSVGYHRRPLIEDIDIGIWQGGILCLIGQVLIDKTALTPAKILTSYVVAI